MTSLLNKRQLADMGHLFASVMVRILTLPYLMVLGMALILAVLVGLAGAPVEIVLNFVLEATGAVAVLQFKLLVITGTIGALSFVVGSYRIDIFVSYAADRLQSKIKGLTLFWESMLAGVHTLFQSPTVPAALIPAEALTAAVRTRFVPGDTPQRE